jgi:homoserine O-acetyltransferase/O-succinyltransferase
MTLISRLSRALIALAIGVAVMPIAISGRNLIFRRILTEAIRNDPGWNGGDYKTAPRHWLYTAPLWPMMLDSPVRLQAQGPTRRAAMAQCDKTVENTARNYDANDFLYWLESSWNSLRSPTSAR